jgi:hypothetical protein
LKVLMKNISIKIKVIFVIVLCMAAVTLALILNLKASYAENVSLVAADSVKEANAAFNNLEENDIKKLSSTLEVLLAVEVYKAPFEKKQRAQLLKLTTPMYQDLKDRFGITNWSFLNRESVGTTFLRVHQPKKFDDSCANRVTYQNAIKTKDFSAGIEQGNIDVGLRVDHPYYDNGRLIGYMELTEGMGDFIDRMKKQTSNDFALLIGKKYLNEQNWAIDRKLKGLENHWGDMKDVVLISQTTGGQGIVDFNENLEDLPEDGKVLEEIHEGDSVFVRGVFPIDDAAGRKIGAMFVIHDVTDMFKALRVAYWKTLILLFVLMFVLCFAIVQLFNRFIFTRLNDISEKVTRLVGGDFHSPIVPFANDEVGRFESLLEKFRSIFVDVLRELENKMDKK